jgi:ribonucleoside-diphosphate reductase beta chain
MFNWDDPLAEKPATDKVDNDLLPVSQQAANELDTPEPTSASVSELPPANANAIMDKLISISLPLSNIHGRGITS